MIFGLVFSLFSVTQLSKDDLAFTNSLFLFFFRPFFFELSPFSISEKVLFCPPRIFLHIKFTLLSFAFSVCMSVTSSLTVCMSMSFSSTLTFFSITLQGFTLDSSNVILLFFGFFATWARGFRLGFHSVILCFLCNNIKIRSLGNIICMECIQLLITLVESLLLYIYTLRTPKYGLFSLMMIDESFIMNELHTL